MQGTSGFNLLGSHHVLGVNSGQFTRNGGRLAATALASETGTCVSPVGGSVSAGVFLALAHEPLHPPPSPGAVLALPL